MTRTELTIDTPVRLAGRIVHADAPPGKIRSLSLRAAEPDLLSLTGKQALDLQPYYGPVVQDQPLLAIDRVRYRGEPVAVVAGMASAELDGAQVSITTEPVSPVATGAKRGAPSLVHVIDLLERAPLAGEIALSSARTNRLMVIPAIGHAPARAAASNRLVSFAKPLAKPDSLVSASASWRDDLIFVWTSSPDRDEVGRELAGITGYPEDRIRIMPAGDAEHQATGAEPLPGAIGVEAIAVATARWARQPVEIIAKRSDFGWSGPRAALAWDERGNALLTIDAGAVAGYLPLWLDDFARLIAERTAACAMVTAELIYSESPPVAASKAEWISALTGAIEAEPR